MGVLCVRAGTLLCGVERSKRRSGLFLLFLFASLQVSISSVSLLSGLHSDTRSAWLTYQAASSYSEPLFPLTIRKPVADGRLLRVLRRLGRYLEASSCNCVRCCKLVYDTFNHIYTAATRPRMPDVNKIPPHGGGLDA